MNARAKRVAGGTIARHGGIPAHALQHQAALPAHHAAVVDGRTLFTSRVFDADAPDRILISGHSNPKVGKQVTKGAWRGVQLYTLTLEERASCPTTCLLWLECYGSSMPFARRVRHGDALIERLDRDLRELAMLGPFAVRLHVLGDFWSIDYARAWARWVHEIPNLHAWGYTAHAVTSPIGALLARLNEAAPDRFAIRFTVAADAPHGDMQVTTIWRKVDGNQQPEGMVCPAQTGGTAACATCGLCWNPWMADQRVVFEGHGRRYRGPRSTQ